MTTGEAVCAGLLLAYLVWVPLPFGSNVAAAYLPLVIPPLVLCAAAALLRSMSAAGLHLSRAYRTWSLAGVAVIAICALQLVPLPPSMAAVVSPESSAIWSAADRVVALTHDAAAVPRAHPITVNPNATWYELFRLIALFATFEASALLISTYRRRVAFAFALSAAALFEALYGIREATLHRYAIWGRVNRLIFDRTTGTFVNPNHFAHYLGVALPFAIYLGAIAWRDAAGGQRMTFGRHLAALIERRFFLFAFSATVMLTCVAGILLAQSRGALLSIVAGMALVTGVLAVAGDADQSPRRRRVGVAVRRTAFTVAVMTLVIAGLIGFLGVRRTMARMQSGESDPGQLGGRRTGIESALRVWRAFPLLGSGAGTFADVVSIGQSESIDKLYQHAHDDYVEIAATLGVAGILIIAAFFYGLLLAFGQHLRSDNGGSWRRRAFGLAALTSIVIASIHALIDFNFFIPSNAATIAAIAGAAVAPSFRSRPNESAAVSSEPPA
ncbi:MAG TPA: O-antigen ligase family protein [Thermoanaerobaculia bacterium]|jgi:O-antigen ligase